jgi:hypothetical protein
MRTSRALARISAAVVVVAALAAAVVPQAEVPQGAAVGGPVRLAFVGDLGQNDNTRTVLQHIGQGGYDAAVAVGDLSYGVAGAEQSFCDFVKANVGEKFPFELLAGNHESNGQNGSINDFSACLPNQLPGVVGTYGRQYYVDVPQVDPVVRLIMVSANLPFPDGFYSYAPGTPRHDWTVAAIDGARASGIPFVVLSNHLNCLGVGNYDCPAGRDIVDLAMNKRVDLVVTGHDHLYARTHLLSTGPACETAALGYDADCVVDSGTDGSYDSVDGTVLATVGTGGQGLYPIDPAAVRLPYMASYAGQGPDGAFGVLRISADADTLSGAFVTAAGVQRDSFSVSRVLTQPPAAPDAPTSLTATPTGAPAVDLAWSHTGIGVTDFVVRRDGQVVATVPASDRTWKDSSVSRGSTYGYDVVARGPGGSSTAASVTATVPSSVAMVLKATRSTWSYRFTAASAPPAGWQATSFSPTGWATGTSPLGFGTPSYIATNIDVPTGTTRPISAQFRSDVTITDPGVLPNVRITTHANDGIIVWVNGVEVGRSNIPAGPIQWNTYATAAPSTTTALATPLTFSVPQSLLVAGTNTVAVEVHLNYRSTSNISMELEMRNSAS